MRLAQRITINYFRTKFKFLSAISKKKAAQKAFNLFCTPMRRNKKPLPGIFHAAEKLQVKLGTVWVHGWRWNHPAERKVLVVHGFESSVINFDRYIKPLIRKGYEVLAFDAPAHGRSGGKTISAPQYKNMIKMINDLYGPIQSFMAHSFGGLAVSLALEELNHCADQRLVLVAPATETTTSIDSFFKFLRLDQGVRQEFERLIIKVGGVSSEWYSIRRAMKHIKAKVLWLHDEEDDVAPLADVARLKQEEYPHIKFIISKGLGHRRIYRDNNVTKAIVDFL